MAPQPSLAATGLALSLLGAGVSGYLTIEHGRAASPICGIGHGCEVVAESAYADLRGIPTAAYGLLMYLGLAVLYGVRLAAAPPPHVEQTFRLAAMAMILAGTGVSGWLTYVELYVLHAVCIWCVVSAAIVTLLLIAAVADLLHTRRLSRGRLATEEPVPNKDS